MIVLNVNHLSLSFGIQPILQDVTFSLNEGDRLGVIGTNGCGKSTLFRLILGEHIPDQGTVHIAKDTTIGILRQEDAFLDFKYEDGSASALEVMFHAFPQLLEAETRLQQLEKLLQSGDSSRTRDSLALEFSTLNEQFIQNGGLEFRSRCASTLQKMGFDEETMLRPFSSLSGGQRTRLALSRELCREPDILMLDEPTNHLDIETLGWLENFLANYKKCLLVISHDRYFLDRVTTKTLCIEHHTADLYNGNYTQSMKKREIDREQQEKRYKEQQKEIARQEAYIAQQRQWNREKNIIAAESRQKLLDKMERIEKPQHSEKCVKITFSTASASGNDVLSVKGLCFSYTASPLIKDLSFLVKRNNRYFILGANGYGKSTVLKLLLGKLTPQKGYIELGYNVRIGYYDQENQNLSPQNSVLEELHSAYPTLTDLTIRNTLAQFRFVGEDVFKRVSELSGGERARLTLAKLILSDVNLLILDEPTNHLDIDSKEALELALEKFDGTVIAVSHDRYFIEKLATHVLDLTPNGAFEIPIMNRGNAYEELCRDRQRRSEQQAISYSKQNANTPSASAELSPKEQYLKNKQDAAEARKAQRRIDRLQQEASKIEAELEQIDDEMSGDAATDYVRLAELDQKKNALEERLLEIYEEI